MDILIKGNMQGIGNVLTIAPENIAFTKITKSSLRLIVNETTGKVLYRHMAHNNITAISYDDEHEETNITFASSVPVMTVTDVFSVKLYVQKEDIIPSDYAKQGTNPNATISAILEALQGSGTPSPDIPEGVAERLAMILEHFGIKPIDGYQPMTEQEVKDINDDVMGALYGYGKVAVTIHSLMRTGAETTQDLASVIYVDPEKTWAENGYPTLYDDEGEPIDTTTNPAAGDEVFNYQIQSES